MVQKYACPFYRILILFFSSPKPKAQGELLWSLTVRRRPSVRPSVHNL